MKESVISSATGKTYYLADAVRIVNVLQAALYLINNVELLDVYGSRDLKTNKPMVVFVFDRKLSFKAYQKWCNHELI